MYYSSIGLLSLVIHVIINFEALRKPRVKKYDSVREKYRSFLYAVTLFYIADILWGLLYDRRWVIPTYIDTMIFFITMVGSVFLWTRFVADYLESKPSIRRALLCGGYVIAFYQIAALIVNFFVPFVFTFAADGEYHPGKARNVALFLQMILFVLTSIYAAQKALTEKGVVKKHHRTVCVSGIVMTIFITLQTLYPLMPFYSIGCLLATCMIHSFIYRDETDEFEREKTKAYKDPLTGVKNKMAYLEALGRIEWRIQEGALTEYGFAVFDVNDLKNINDTLGHSAGDEYIKKSCEIICNKFKHSPVFRIGGDEFVVILEGSDYEEREAILESFNEQIERNLTQDGLVIACGMTEFNPQKDENCNDVFKRADKRMYKRKEQLKAK